MLDAELGEVTWIAGAAKPTVADIALYSYIDRAPEVNVDLTAYANVKARLRSHFARLSKDASDRGTVTRSQGERLSAE